MNSENKYIAKIVLYIVISCGGGEITSTWVGHLDRKENRTKKTVANKKNEITEI